MKGYFPGTRIETKSIDPQQAELVIGSIFSAGGLVLSQVSNLSGIEYYSVQNWIKRGFCSSPVKKKYSRRQFSRLVIINMLKDSFEIPDIVSLLSSLNGRLNDESDDTIDDSDLYICFLSVINRLEAELGSGSFSDERMSTEAVDDTIRRVSEAEADRYSAECGVNKKKLACVLRIMTNAYLTAHFRAQGNMIMSAGD